MTQSFDTAFAFTHKQENGSADAFVLSTLEGESAETFSGIYRLKQPQWPGWQLIDAGDTTSQQLKDMVKTFFFSRFWVRPGLEQLPFPLSALAYDFGVSSGDKTAIMKLQHLLMQNEDGQLGPKTIGAARDAHPYKLMMNYIGIRQDYLNGLSAWKINNGGWSQRIAEILYFAAK